MFLELGYLLLLVFVDGGGIGVFDLFLIWILGFF